MTGDLTCCK